MTDLFGKYKTVLVTGASGQLGRRLVPELLRRRYTVRAHFRSEEKARRWCPPHAIPVYGDLTALSWLPGAVRDCDFVIHCAARVSLRSGDVPDMAEINVDGTRAVINACRTAGVKRLVHVSSIAAVGGSTNDSPLDESSPFNLSGFDIPYFETKHLAEQLALRANDGRLDVVVVNPAIMISPPDRALNRADHERIPGRIPFYFDFGINLVQTEDVIDGIIRALEKGQPGQRYILGGENVSSQKLVELAVKYIGIKRPILKVPRVVLFMVAMIVELLGSNYSPIKKVFPASKLNRNLVRLAGLKFYYNSQKAYRELGYKPRPLEQSIIEILTAYEGRRGPSPMPIKKAAHSNGGLIKSS